MRFEKKDFALLIPATLLAIAGLGPDDPWVIGPCLLLSWITFLVICWVHEGSINARVGVAVLITLLLGGVGYRRLTTIYRPPTVTKSAPEQPPESFIVSKPRCVLHMARDFRASLPIWGRYMSSHGLTISPVAVALYVDITSRVATPETIQFYRVAIKTPSCGWSYLSPMKASLNHFFWLQDGGIARAIPLDFSGNGLDFIFAQPVKPFATVSGWLLFDSREKCPTSPGDSIQFRIAFDTFGGRHFDGVTESTIIPKTGAMPGNPDANMTEMNFVVPPGSSLEDLSHDYRRFYSDQD